MIRGLTIGKYAPLHLGHLRLIETALAEVDELYVIIYNAPDHTDIPLNIRANWIKSLYPEVNIIKAWDVPKDVGWTEEIQQKHENYILSLIGPVKIDAFYSSEAYGHRMSKALGCANRTVDIDRSVIEISGTVIRSNVYQYRQYLKPNVYEDHIISVGILGDYSHKMDKLLRSLTNLFNTPYIMLKSSSDHVLTDKFTEPLCATHEDLLMQANQFIFVQAEDTPTLNLDVLFVESGFDGKLSTKTLRTLDSLRAMKKPYFILKGTVEAQLCYIEGVLSTYKKYMNLADMIEFDNNIC